MIIFGLIGNIIVIYVTNKQKRKSVVDQYVKNLAIAGKKYAHIQFLDNFPSIQYDFHIYFCPFQLIDVSSFLTNVK